MGFRVIREFIPIAKLKEYTLCMREFETRTATGSGLFFLLTCLHTITFTLLSIVSLLEMTGVKIGETPLAWHAKCSLLVAVGVSKTRVLKLRAVTLLVNAIKSIFTSS